MRGTLRERVAACHSFHQFEGDTLADKKVRTASMRVLAVGAAGQFAGLVVPELVRRGVTVRGMVHKPEDVKVALSLGATEVVVGELNDTESVKSALAGMEGVFYIAPAFLRSEGEVGKRFVQSASEAGVRRFVFSSVIHPILSELSNHAAKAPVEEALIDSGMQWVFLQPAMFFQNIGAAWEKASMTGIYAEPWSNDTRFTRVDFRDVAEVAALAMTEDSLLYGTFELCSDGNLDRHNLTALMSEVMGRLDVPAKAQIPPAAGLPPELTRMFDWYDKHSLLGNALTLRAILGREPRTLRSYLEDLNSKSSR